MLNKQPNTKPKAHLPPNVPVWVTGTRSMAAKTAPNIIPKPQTHWFWLATICVCGMLLSMLLTGCNHGTPAPQQTVLSVQGETMGTTYAVKWTHTVDGNEDVTKKVVKTAVDDRLEQINDAMSTYRDTSEISRFNQTEPKVRFKISKDFYDTLTIAQATSKKTNGAFDITVMPLVNAWGFGPDGRITKQPSTQIIALAKASIGYEKLQLIKNKPLVVKKSPVTIDLSAIAKGYAVDAVAAMLEQKGIGNYFVEVGGEAYAHGFKPNIAPWIVAIEKPDSATVDIQQAIKLGSQAIATSGDYRNYFEEAGVRYSHTIDPVSGYPISHKLASVSVLRSTCAEADALATALMVMGDEKGVAFAKNHNISALFLVKAAHGFSEITTGHFADRIINMDDGDESKKTNDDA